MPNNQSQEKIDLLRFLGAEVYPVPVVPFTDPQNYNHQARQVFPFIVIAITFSTFFFSFNFPTF